jgi:hypothetical protein
MHLPLSTSDTLAATLRRFAYTRANGSIELCSPAGSPVALMLVCGRIAAIEAPGWNLVEVVILRLREGGRIPQSLPLPVFTIDSLFKALQETSTLSTAIDEVFFRRVVREVTLDKLLDLGIARATVSGSGALRGDISPTFSPALDTEDLRYDLEGFGRDAARFEKIFPPHSVIERVPAGSPRLSAVEQGILNLLGEALEVDSLFRQALLSRIRFYEGLLSLFDRRLIAVRNIEELDPAAVFGGKIGSVIDAAVEVEVVAQEIAAAAMIQKAETTLLETSLSPRNIVALFRRLAGG